MLAATTSPASMAEVYIIGGVVTSAVAGVFGLLVRAITSQLHENTRETNELAKIVVELRTEQRDVIRRVETLERVR